MSLTAVLFAGGLSSRMGSEKATLEISGQPLWAKQLDILRALEPENIWVSARSRPIWCPGQIEAVLDAPPSRGPLSGLAEALVRMRTSHLLALAVDLPQMTATELRRLWELAQPGWGVVPAGEKGFEPLAAIYPREAAPFAQAALDSGELSLQAFVETLRRENQIRLHPLTESERRFFENVNTPDDLRRVFS